jgi:hypothetical protein
MFKTLELSCTDIISFVISAIVHDFKHTGQTNSYHINKQTEIALLYNDISVLENYHISETYKILTKSQCNIFEKFSKEEVKLMRKRIVDMILSTDMSLHTRIYTSMKLKNEQKCIEKGTNVAKLVIELDNAKAKFESKQEILNYTLHAADLSHNVKVFPITEKWTSLLMEEFFLQGDLEKSQNLPISFNCDRENTNIPRGQIGFINGIILPTFHLLCNIFPQVEFLVDNAKDNLKIWNILNNEAENKDF